MDAYQHACNMAMFLPKVPQPRNLADLKHANEPREITA